MAVLTLRLDDHLARNLKQISKKLFRNKSICLLTLGMAIVFPDSLKTTA